MRIAGSIHIVILIRFLLVVTLIIPATLAAQMRITHPETPYLFPGHEMTAQDSADVLRGLSYGMLLPADSSIAYFDSMRRYWIERRNTYAIVQYSNHMANAYARAGKYVQSRTFLIETVFFVRMFSDGIRYMPSLYNNIASICIFEGLHEEAIRNYLQSVRYVEQYGYQYQHPQFLARLYNNVANAFNLINEYKKAHHYIRVADSFAQKARDSVEIAHILLTRGEIYRCEHNFDACEQDFTQAMQMATAIKNEELHYLSLNAISTLLNKRNQPQKAIDILSKVVKPNSGQYATPYYRNLLARELGDACFQMGRYHDAIRYITQALETAEQAGMQSQVIHLYQMLAESYAAIGRSDDAYRYLQVYHNLKDSIAYSEQARHGNELEVQFRTAQKDNELIKKELLISRQAHKLEQQNRNIVIAVTSILVLIAMLVALWLKRRLQNKKILALQQQQEITRLRSIVEGEEKERARLSRELHDGIGGMLAAINMNVSALYKTHTEIAELPTIIKMVKTTTEEVRKTAHDLMPDVLIRHNLNQAIRLYCEQVSASGRLHITLSFIGASQLHKSAELILYRIIQELVQNIIKHAHATEAFIEIDHSDENISIIVEDNGIGFDTEKNNGGFGIQNLTFRINSLKGKISIESAPGSGTTIHITFDLSVLKNMIAYEHQNSHSR